MRPRSRSPTARTSATISSGPTLNDRVIGWAQSNATVVFDRAERRLVSLPIPDGKRSAVTIAGPLMVWAEENAGTVPHRGWPDWLVIVNTDTLPVRP